MLARPHLEAVQSDNCSLLYCSSGSSLKKVKPQSNCGTNTTCVVYMYCQEV